jgi:hypothetical protein
MSWLSSFMKPGKGYDKAQNQLDKYYGQSQGFIAPYANNGEQAYGGLSEAMQALLNPQELQDKWAGGYKESEAAKNAQGIATEHGLDAASSMGLMGSTPALQAIQAGTTKISLDERQKYLDDIMQKYMSAVGIGQNIYGTGANAAMGQSQNATQMGNNSAQMAFGKQNAGGDAFSKLLGGAAKLGGDYLTGGFGTGSFGRGAWSPTGG